MSLYNQLFGINPMTPIYLASIHLPLEEVPRFRDCYLFKEAGEIRLGVLARLGGFNRQQFSYQIGELKKHPNYVRDFDDDVIDSTYATFVFRVSDRLTIPPAEVVPVSSPMIRFKKLLDDMKNNRDNEATRRAIEVGKKMFEGFDFKNPESRVIEI